MKSFLDENMGWKELNGTIKDDKISAVEPLKTVEINQDGYPVLNGRLMKESLNQFCRLLGVTPHFFMEQSPELKMDVINANMDRSSNFRIIGSDTEIRLLRAEEKPYMGLGYQAAFIESLCDQEWTGGIRLKTENKHRFNTEVFVYSAESVVPTEDLRYGVNITLNEIGSHPLDVNYGIFRIVCLNGLMVGAANGNLGSIKISDINMNTPLADYLGFINKDTLQIPLKTFLDFYEFTTKNEDTVSGMIDMVRYGRKANHVPKSVGDNVLSQLAARPQDDIMSYWDVVNTLTDSAKRLGPAQARAEKGAYTLIEEWRKLS